MHTFFSAVAAALLATCLAACNTGPAAQPADSAAEVPPPAPGSDRDTHGCIPSAGYTWCAKTASCERPWELAKAQGFESDAAAFDAFCANPAPQDGGGVP